MLYAFLGFAALIGLIAACRILAAKASMLESERRELEARRILSEIRSDDVRRLREENAVFRNLLLDIVENEASLATGSQVAVSEQTRRYKIRLARRRELFGEAVVVLDTSAAPDIHIPRLAQKQPN